MRLVLLLATLLLAAAPSAQPFTFQPADGPLSVSPPVYHDAGGLVLADFGARSTDAGRTWQDVGGAPRLSSVVRRGDALWGSSLGPLAGIVRSADDGLTWQTVSLDEQPLLGLAAPDSFYVRTVEGRLLRSADGTEWTDLGIDLGVGFRGLAASAGGLVAAITAGSPNGTLYLSRDYGATFAEYTGRFLYGTFAFDNGTLYGVRDDDGFGDPVGGGLFRLDEAAVAFVRVGPEASATGPLRRQPDGRLTYAADGVLRAVGAPDPDVPPTAGQLDDAALFPGSVLLFATGSEGALGGPDSVPVAASGFGSAWSDGGPLLNVGLARPLSVWAVTRDTDGRFLIGGQDVFHLDGVWRPTLSRIRNARRFVPLWNEPDSLYVVPNRVLSSSRVRYPSAVVVGGATVPVSQVSPVLDSVCPGEVYGIGFDGSRAFVSCDPSLGGRTLRTVGRDGTVFGVVETTDRINAFAVTDAGVWAGSEGGDLVSGDPPVEVSVRFSDDGGQTWTDRSAGLAGDRVYDFVQFGGNLFAAGDGGIARWDGTAWVRELDNPFAFIFAEAGGVLFAGGTGAVHRRAPGGSWETTAAGLEGDFVQGLEAGMDADGIWLVAGTSAGLQTTRPGLVVGAEDSPPTADRSRLRAYPNPARGVVTIDTPDGVQTNVFDAVGRRVAQLAASRDGVARWDARNVPPGVYLIRSSDAQTARVVVLR